MPDKKKLRKSYDQVLTDIWTEWDEHTLDLEMSPFTNIESIPELEDSPGFNYSVGWAEGISVAMGWPLDPPGGRPLGPKQWSPKGRHPQ